MTPDEVRKIVREEIAAANKEAVASTTTLQEVAHFYESIKKMSRKSEQAEAAKDATALTKEERKIAYNQAVDTWVDRLERVDKLYRERFTQNIPADHIHE